MPLEADEDSAAPPARATVLSAAENVPTVRTCAVLVESASTRKSAGRVDAVVPVAGIPIPSKVC
jgi:hypothetical protein